MFDLASSIDYRTDSKADLALEPSFLVPDDETNRELLAQVFARMAGTPLSAAHPATLRVMVGGIALSVLEKRQMDKG